MQAITKIGALVASANVWRKSIGSKAKQTRRLIVARVKRRRSHARFIVVTGSSGKTTTTLLLAHLLSPRYKLRVQANENTFPNAVAVLSELDGSEDLVILETGTLGPGRLKAIMDLVRPDLAVVTLVALEHYAAFRNVAAIAEEKSAAVTALPATGIAILNRDDPAVAGMAARTRARSVTFGSSGADHEIKDPCVGADGRLSLTLRSRGRETEFVTQLVGQHNSLAVAAAIACAREIGLDDETIERQAATFEPLSGRMSRNQIANGPTFILDTYKAPYFSINLPIETLGAIEAPRKRFVLGQISDYAGNPTKKYRDTYRAALQVADEVIFVGPYGNRARATQDEISGGRFRSFENVEDAAKYLKATAVEDEVIMVKSSRNLHLERLMLIWNSEVRCWPNDCGLKVGCMECGLFDRPFTEHGGNRKFYKTKKHRFNRLFAKFGYAKPSL